MKKPEDIKIELLTCLVLDKPQRYQHEAIQSALLYIHQLETELASIKRERDAAVRDCACFPCYTCKERKNGDYCTQCMVAGTFRTWHEWRGPCEENGGAEDEKA